MTASRHLDQLEQRSRIMPSGDYQIQVHLIECRDLTGLHDPYVRVKVMGRVKKTRVIRKVWRNNREFNGQLYWGRLLGFSLRFWRHASV